MEQQRNGAETARAYDGRVATWQVAMQIRTRLHRELYRREREQYPQWIDLGGEGGEG